MSVAPKPLEPGAGVAPEGRPDGMDQKEVGGDALGEVGAAGLRAADDIDAVRLELVGECGKATFECCLRSTRAELRFC